MPTALLVYYSFTGQALRVVDQAAGTLRQAGYEVSLARVDFALPDQRLQRPVSPARLKQLTSGAQNAVTEPVTVDPPDVLDRRYDLVCLVSNTWQHHPCVPVRSVLRDARLQAVLKDTAFAVYVVCRRSWENNLRIIREEAEACGGRYIGGDHFDHRGSNLGSLIRTISYIVTRGDRVARLFGLRLPLPEYGLATSTVERVSTFTRKIIAPATPHRLH